MRGFHPVPPGVFRHAVSAPQRERSLWFEELACWVTPEGLSWVYTDTFHDACWRDARGEPISVAVLTGWLEDEELEEFRSRDRPRHPESGRAAAETD